MNREELIALIEKVFNIMPFMENTYGNSHVTEQWIEIRKEMAKIVHSEIKEEFDDIAQLSLDTRVRRELGV